jgi:hypothetical protein
MVQAHSRILLAIFFLSVSVIPAIEVAHDVLHTFENPFHHHATGHRSYSSHTSGDHHPFGKMKFAHEMEESQSADNLVWFAYAFCAAIGKLTSSRPATRFAFNTFSCESYLQVSLLPLTPPPLASLYRSSI